MKFFPYTDNCRLNKILKTSEHRSISLIVLLLIFSFLFLLGYLYENGKGVPQDYKEALKWFRLAAEQGVTEAQFGLGLMYAHGRGVPQDVKEALKWYRLAAEKGNAAARKMIKKLDGSN